MDEAVKVFFVLAAVVGGPLLAVLVIPALVKRFLGTLPPPASRRKDEDATEHEMESLAQRVTELEERVDFAERLLARQRDADLPKLRS